MQIRGGGENGGAAVKMEVVVVAAPWCSAREDGRDGCCNGGRRGELRERWRSKLGRVRCGNGGAAEKVRRGGFRLGAVAGRMEE